MNSTNYDGLVYGQSYTVLDSDPHKRQLRLRDSNQRQRWYPTQCFATTPPPTIKALELDIPDWGLSEATITYSDGTRRWCVLATPAQLQDQLTRGEQSYLAIPNLVIVTQIDEPTLRHALTQMLECAELQQSTLPITDPDEP